MKKALLTSFVAASISFGCSNQTTEPEQKTSAVKTDQGQTSDPKLQAWVGKYEGIIPCATCISRCEGCDSMGVDLELHPDMSFKLVRTSYSTQSAAEVYTGHYEFLDGDKLKIQLNEVKDRNILVLGADYTEIIDTKSGQPYAAYPDFQLEKISS